MMEETQAAEGLSIEHLEARLDVTYNWGYASTRKDLRDLYGKATRLQWISDDKLPWSIDVDPQRASFPEELLPIFGSDIYARLDEPARRVLRGELGSWMISQFLHGEQGALLAASQLVTSVPDIDAKFYAATQVMDEARHVEVYDRYLHQKFGWSYPISAHLRTLLDLILKDSRWDMKLLGMQVMVEGLALAAFGMIRQTTTEPLLARVTHYVMLDEARHVAFGVLALRDLYGDMKESERREREDFVYEASVLMRDRFLFDQVWEKLGMPVEECKRFALESESQRLFRQMLFSKIVPVVKRCGLLSPRQRARFDSLGILQFEAADDPFDALDEKDLAPLTAA
jgi:hypothetical protein